MPIEKKYEDLFERLAAPFLPGEVKTRKGAHGDLSYITARTARRRLDEILGNENWTCDITAGDRWVKCRLVLHLGDQLTVWREALGGYPVMPSEEDSVKGGDSDAFKRAAAAFGVGEYLYGDEEFAVTPATRSPKPVDRAPGTSQGSVSRPQSSTNRWGRDELGWPITGSALYAWAMKIAEKFGCENKYEGVNIIQNTYGSKTGYRWPRDFRNWDEGQVRDGALCLASAVASWDGYAGQFDKELGAVENKLSLDLGDFKPIEDGKEIPY